MMNIIRRIQLIIYLLSSSTNTNIIFREVSLGASRINEGPHVAKMRNSVFSPSSLYFERIELYCNSVFLKSLGVHCHALVINGFQSGSLKEDM